MISFVRLNEYRDCRDENTLLFWRYVLSTAQLIQAVFFFVAVFMGVAEVCSLRRDAAQKS